MAGVLLVLGPRRAVVFPGRRERENLYSDTTPGGGGTPIHYLYGYVPPNGVVILKLLI